MGSTCSWIFLEPIRSHSNIPVHSELTVLSRMMIISTEPGPQKNVKRRIHKAVIVCSSLCREPVQIYWLVVTLMGRVPENRTADACRIHKCSFFFCKSHCGDKKQPHAFSHWRSNEAQKKCIHTHTHTATAFQIRLTTSLKYDWGSSEEWNRLKGWHEGA